MSGWASGIAFDGKQLRATIHHPDGTVEQAEPARLAEIGVPHHGTKRRSLETSLRAWSHTDAAKHLAATGLAQAHRHRHAVYAYKAYRETVVVPALVFMRAFFRPAPSVLPAMFHPQGLERLVQPCTGDASGRVAWHNLPPHDRHELERESLLAPLSWMYSFPSARAMCGSVHEFALAGAIDLTLPKADVRMVCRGRKMGDVFLVGSISILELVAKEDPLPFAANHTGRLALHGNVREGAAGSPQPSCLAAPLSDAEWEHIAPILAGRARRVHDSRTLLAIALHRLATGTPWRALPFPPALRACALTAWHTWRKREVWDQAISALERLRGPAPVADSPNAPNAAALVRELNQPARSGRSGERT